MLREITLVLACAALAHGQSAPRLLADLDPRVIQSPPPGSQPADFARLGAWTFFGADDGVHGRELFHTNGTVFGTSLFLDLRPGPAGSSPRDLVAVGIQLFFVADDGVDGPQLFVSDGAAAGTRRIATGIPGPRSFHFTTDWVLGQRLVFLALSGVDLSNGLLVNLWR